MPVINGHLMKQRHIDWQCGIHPIAQSQTPKKS